MQLQEVLVFDEMEPQHFQRNYYKSKKPVVIKKLAKQWPAYSKWNWQYFKNLVGDQCVAPHNNIKRDTYTPVNTVMTKNIWENERT